MSDKLSALKSSEGYYIQGQKASSYEYNVARALENLGYEYYFQYPIYGGREKPGGQVIDFIIYTTPLYTPLEVNGNYWHKDALFELKQEIAVNDYFWGRMNKLEILWGEQCDTYEHAQEALKDLLL